MNTKYFFTDEETGEIKPVTKISERGKEVNVLKHITGSPKEYRFDGSNGNIKIGENPIIEIDDKGKPKQVKSIKFTPIAFRFFKDCLFNRKDKITQEPKFEQWAELFFIDSLDSVSMIMFSNSSCNALISLQRELFLEDLSLLDVVLEVSSTEKGDGDKKWSLAVFDYEILPVKEVEELQQLESLINPYNLDTLTEKAVYQMFEGSFFRENIKQHKKQIEQ